MEKVTDLMLESNIIDDFGEVMLLQIFSDVTVIIDHSKGWGVGFNDLDDSDNDLWTRNIFIEVSNYEALDNTKAIRMGDPILFRAPQG
jgi:hypothetical protein